MNEMILRIYVAYESVNERRYEETITYQGVDNSKTDSVLGVSHCDVEGYHYVEVQRSPRGCKHLRIRKWIVFVFPIVRKYVIVH